MDSVTTKTSPRIAQRMDPVGFSEIAALREAIAVVRQQGHQVFELHGGEPYFETPQPIKDATNKALAENQTRYPPVKGIAPLRQALAEKVTRRNRIAATPENIQVTNGGIHGLYCSFQVTLDPGDEILLFSPYWTPIRDLVKLAGARPVEVDTLAARQQGIAAALNAGFTERTRAIYFNSPQNPTGVVFSRGEQQEVAEFAQERELVVIADEAYEDILYGAQHVSIGSLPGMAERTITIFTFSKSYSMTGWRAGYAVAAEPWMGALRKLALYTTTGVPTPIQWAMLRAVQSPLEELQQRCCEFQRRRDLLVGGLRSLGFEVAMPEGAFYVFPGITRLGVNSDAASKLLLEKARVSCISGSVFGERGEGHVRMTFSAAPEVLQGAIEAMRRAL
jgi:aspartate/methionine/tyrosine aminotransferase